MEKWNLKCYQQRFQFATSKHYYNLLPLLCYNATLLLTLLSDGSSGDVTIIRV